jgi:hypothetical protein
MGQKEDKHFCTFGEKLGITRRTRRSIFKRLWKTCGKLFLAPARKMRFPLDIFQE